MTRSTGPEDAGDRDDAYVPGAYAMERHLREIARFMVGRQFATVEEAQRALAERFVGKRMDTALPEDPIERAQEYAFRAMEARDVVESLPWVEQALALDPECPDALRLKAAWEGDPKRRDAFLARAAATALARLGGEEFLRRERGHVWRVTMARPYMRVVAAQAEALHAAGPLSDAAEAYGRLLDLDTGDSMGVRYTLQEIHLERGDVKAWEALWRRYEDEKSAFFLWGAVLAALLKGDEAAADRARALAEKSNRHVPRLLL